MSENIAKDKRNNPRTGIQIWAMEKTEGYTCFHLVSNLSTGGLHIDKKLPLPIGSTINLEITLLDPAEKISLKGIVVNTYKDSDLNITGTGVEFIEMSEEIKKKLETYIERNSLTL